MKKGKTQEVHKDETSWDAFVKSFKDWMTNIWTDSFASIKFLLSHPNVSTKWCIKDWYNYYITPPGGEEGEAGGII